MGDHQRQHGHHSKRHRSHENASHSNDFNTSTPSCSSTPCRFPSRADLERIREYAQTTEDRIAADMLDKYASEATAAALRGESKYQIDVPVWCFQYPSHDRDKLIEAIIKRLKQGHGFYKVKPHKNGNAVVIYF